MMNNVADVIPHNAKVVYIVSAGDKNVILSNISCMCPCHYHPNSGLSAHNY